MLGREGMDRWRVAGRVAVGVRKGARTGVRRDGGGVGGRRVMHKVLLGYCIARSYRVGRLGGTAMTPLRPERLFLGLVVIVRKGGKAGSGMASLPYCRWSFAAPFTFIIVRTTCTIGALFLHAFGKGLEEYSTFETHFLDTTFETYFAEPKGVIVLLDFIHSALEFNAFLLVCFFDRGR